MPDLAFPGRSPNLIEVIRVVKIRVDDIATFTEDLLWRILHNFTKFVICIGDDSSRAGDAHNRMLIKSEDLIF